MSANKRFAVGVFWVSVISLFTFALPPSVASCDDSLAPLVADYRDYGLPEPSELAEFSLLKWSTGTTNGGAQLQQNACIRRNRFAGQAKVLLGWLRQSQTS